MRTTNKLLLGILASVSVGVIIGILFAPEKGKNTRKFILDKGKKLTDSIKDSASKITSNIGSEIVKSYQNTIQKADEIITNLSKKST